MTVFCICFQVNVEIRSTKIREEEFTLAMPFENFIGNMGGILNLWIGISFITVIELIELMMNIVGKFVCKEPNA